MTTTHQIAIQTAKTIVDQIGRRTMWALGADKITAMRITDKSRGGLVFLASFFGRAQVIVEVELTPADLYRVRLLQPRSRRELAAWDEVFCESLSSVVESAVEAHFAKRA